MSLRTVLKRGLYSTGVSTTLARRDGSSFILAAHIVLEEEAQALADVIHLLRRRFSLVSLDEYLAALRTATCRNHQRAVGPASSPHLPPRVHIRWDLPELAWTPARVARG
jgi:hypothetical protein